MTCQWCKHYRYRITSKTRLCVAPGSDGKILDAKHGAAPCPKFDPRRICTTCAFRCTPEDKSTLTGENDRCPKWKLRQIAAWGGRRNFRTQVRAVAQTTNSTQGGN